MEPKVKIGYIKVKILTFGSMKKFSVDKISLYTNGSICIKCNNNKLYILKDNKVKCSKCKSYYSLNKISLDLWSLYYFSIETTANKVSKELNVNYKTVHSRYKFYRNKIYEYQNKTFHPLKGEIECDESYFGGRRKGNRGRGSANKIIVLGLLDRKGKIYTTVVENVTAECLLKQIQDNSIKGSVFYTDKFKSYNSLKFYRKHLTIDHQNRFAMGKNHINGLEGFWSYAKERLLKYHGVSKNNFKLYLKEIEFRYNNRDKNMFNLFCEIILNLNINTLN